VKVLDLGDIYGITASSVENRMKPRPVPNKKDVDDPYVLALIPAYNEERHIADVVTATRLRLPVLVVDDGSTDRSAARAETAGAQLLRQSPNQGKGAALRAGFRYATEKNFQAVVTLDADGQHDPAEIPKFIHRYQQAPADLIIGARDFSKIPLVRRLTNTFGRWSFSWALGQPDQDNQSGYRLISRRMIEAMLSSQEVGFEFEVEMIVVCVQCGYTLDWVPIRTIYAGERSHINPLRHTIHYFRMLWQTRQRMRSRR
jgi:glycosyltransferase involved in cell wall biosynthesis